MTKRTFIDFLGTINPNYVDVIDEDTKHRILIMQARSNFFFIKVALLAMSCQIDTQSIYGSHIVILPRVKNFRRRKRREERERKTGKERELLYLILLYFCYSNSI